MEKLGELLGWLTILCTGSAILNFILKYSNTKYKKEIENIRNGREIMNKALKIFVPWHRYFGIGALVFLILHLIVQISRLGLNITGIVAAAFLVLEVLLGIYSIVYKMQRKGAWFKLHRINSWLIIFSVALHLLMKI